MMRANLVEVIDIISHKDTTTYHPLVLAVYSPSPSFPIGT